MCKSVKSTLLLLLLLAVSFLSFRILRSGQDFPVELPWKARLQLKQELSAACALLDDQTGEVDRLEACLIDAGLAVLDSDPVYPSYLANNHALISFWESAQKGLDVSLSLFRIPDSQTLRHLFFLHKKGDTGFFTTDVRISDGAIVDTAFYPIQDMELAEWGIFYYRLYPAGDPHYIDYDQIRLEPVDQTLYDGYRRYILPVGYQLVNLFLVDWQEGNWGKLSFHDTLEFLYARNTGTTLRWEDYPRDSYPSRVRIPADLFEENILPYFQIPLEEFRRHCGYDSVTETYPYRAIRGDDLTAWHYVMCEPEVMEIQTNRDGTLTLKIQVYAPDLKTDRLFCHNLTVRPLEADRFQYVSNEVIYVSSYGLPPALSRFELDE